MISCLLIILVKKDILKNLSFTLNKTDKVAFLSDNSSKITMLFDVLTGENEIDSGSIKWGKTITYGYLPSNNNKFFENSELSLVDWLKQYSLDKNETFIRGWLGRMLFFWRRST